MAADPLNPFGLPGLNPASSNEQTNPLAASLDLMQRALSSFGHSASLASDSMTQTMNPEELEKRIADLRAVENWLKLNLSMLSGSIQGLEVQLATIKTLRSFVEIGAQTTTTDNAQASPLEVVLGLKKPAQPQPSDTPEASAQIAQAQAINNATMNAQAAKAWWDVLQNQFSQLAQATTQAAQFSQSSASSDESSKPAIKRARRTASKQVAKTAKQKTTPSKTPKKPRG